MEIEIAITMETELIQNPKPPAEDCIINDMFENSNNPNAARIEYCRDFCQWKCMTGKRYKRREV